jgi:hypothetical protein
MPESPARVAARKRRDAIRAAQRRAARRKRDLIRDAQREAARRRRREIRKALREEARLRRDALRRLARELAREKRLAERRLLRAQRRALLRQKYVTRMVLNASGNWVWVRVSGPSYMQAQMAVRGQKAYYPRFALRSRRAGRAARAFTP